MRTNLTKATNARTISVEQKDEKQCADTYIM